MTVSCSERAATLVRGAVERILAITLRQWVAIMIAFVVCAATGIQQYLAYRALLPAHEVRYAEMSKLNEDCKKIKKTHETAYISLEKDCKKANMTIQFSPEWSAFTNLVNTTWPHSDNLVLWTASVLSKIFSSIQAMILCFACVVFFWPSVKRHGIGFMKDEINKRKERKLEKELLKIAGGRALSTAIENLKSRHSCPLEDESLLTKKKQDNF